LKSSWFREYLKDQENNLKKDIIEAEEALQDLKTELKEIRNHVKSMSHEQSLEIFELK
jgi:prefoldin subunit 5